MKQELSLEELKSIRLDMLREIHSCCNKNGIKYSLSCGTLLGAIRHHGYIPWDDDVDIMMPLPDMIRFKKEFNSKTMKYCDVDTEKNYENSFSEIVDLRSYRKMGLIGRGRGIGIDLYPVISIDDEQEKQSIFFKKGIVHYNKILIAQKWKCRLQHYLSIDGFPGMMNLFLKYRNYLLFQTPQYGTTNTYYVDSGPLASHQRRTFNYDLFSKLVEVDFEGIKLNCTIAYDSYLSQLYGDYMKYPPENQRHPYHGQTYYWK